MTVHFGAPVVGPSSADTCRMDTNMVDCTATYQDHPTLSPAYSDHSLCSVDLSAYASSPNSLYMYEQERSDMANSFDTCRLMPVVKMEESGELSPGMEDATVNLWNEGANNLCANNNGRFSFMESWPGKDLGLLNMDDIFQVDSTEAAHGPTLAELNSQDSLHYLDDIGDLSKNRMKNLRCAEFDEDEVMKSLVVKPLKRTVNPQRKIFTSPRAAVVPTVVQQKDNTTTVENYTLSQLLTAPSANGEVEQKQVDKCAQAKPAMGTRPIPMDDNLLKKWEEIKEFIHGDNETETPQEHTQPVKREKTKELLVDDEDPDDGDWNDSDHSDDDDENMSDIGQRALAGIMHGGKQRRGDGNDIIPNPKKMYNIGLELKKINKLINDMTPVSELPVNARPRSRREKNKLASRACRLKKKAQHEANKVKLFGLDREHEKLNAVLKSIKAEIQACVQHPDVKREEKMSTKLQNLIQKHLTHMIAGHTTEYVNTVLEKVAAGDPHGGIRNN